MKAQSKELPPLPMRSDKRGCQLEVFLISGHGSPAGIHRALGHFALCWGFAEVHGPMTPEYIWRASRPILFLFSFLFFFILTLIDFGRIKKFSKYGGEPSLHSEEFSVMDWPSGPSRSQFLMFSFFTVCLVLLSHWEEKPHRLTCDY